jgi:hypothetical protein
MPQHIAARQMSLDLCELFLLANACMDLGGHRVDGPDHMGKPVNRCAVVRAPVAVRGRIRDGTLFSTIAAFFALQSATLQRS